MAKSSSGKSGGGTSGSASSKGAGGTQGSKSSSGKSSGGGFSSGGGGGGSDRFDAPNTSVSKTGFSVSGQTGGGGGDSWGWDRNKDGNISLAEKVLDMIDGGGRGQTGPTFEGGPLSGALNALGVAPYGQGSGRVSGFVDPILGTSPPGAGPVIAPALAPIQPTVVQGPDDRLPGTVVLPPNTPNIPTTPETPPADVTNIPPNLAYLLSPADVSAQTPSQFTFEEYLAQLPPFIAPSPIASLPVSAPPQIQQGIASLSPLPVAQPMAQPMSQPMGMASAPAEPPLYFDALGRPMGLMG